MKFISFYSDKGGVGKSTLTMNVASIMKERFNLNVVIVDVVNGYRSLMEDRNNDLEKYSHLNIKEDDYVRIVKISVFKQFIQFSKYLDADILLLDVQSMTRENLHFLLKCEYIFLITDDVEDFHKDLKTYEAFKNVIGQSDEFALQDLFFIFNKFRNTENERECIEKIDKELFVEPVIPYSNSYKNLNTLKPNLTKEMIELTQNIVTKLEIEKNE